MTTTDFNEKIVAVEKAIEASQKIIIDEIMIGALRTVIIKSIDGATDDNYTTTKSIFLTRTELCKLFGITKDQEDARLPVLINALSKHKIFSNSDDKGDYTLYVVINKGRGLSYVI